MGCAAASGGAASWNVRRLINALGGDTVVKACYHRLHGQNAAPLTTWSDPRGTGFGPNLTVGSAALDASKNYLAFTATCAAFCAASSVFDASTSCSLVYIGSVGNGTFKDAVVIDDSASQTRNFEIGTNTPAGQIVVWSSVGGVVNPGALGVTDASTPNKVRLIVVNQVDTTHYNGQVYNHASAAFTTGGAMVASGNNAFNINTWQLTSTTGEASLLVRCVLFVKPSITTAQMAILAQYAQADAGIAVAA